MASVEPRALRRIIRHIDETTAAGYHRDPKVAYRLGVMTRRVSVRVADAARDLATAAGAVDATAELRVLAASVRAGNTTWEHCVAGKADHLPEVHAWYATTERPSRVAPVDAGNHKHAHKSDHDDDEGIGPILRRR